MNRQQYALASAFLLNRLPRNNPSGPKNFFQLNNESEKTFLEKYEEATKDGRATPFVLLKLGPNQYVSLDYS